MVKCFLIVAFAIRKQFQEPKVLHYMLKTMRV